MTERQLGSLYARVPKFKELCDRIAFLERVYPGSMSPTYSVIETARSNLLMGRIDQKDLRRFERWAATTLRGINKSIERVEAKKARTLARRGRLN